MSEDQGLLVLPIWHDDGDIVLSVTENGIEHRFRVHKLILRMASAVFRDMLEIPQPADTGKEGYPIVSLDDSPRDLQALLNALYRGLSMLHDNQLTLDISLSILLLSDKYAIDDLRHGIIRVLLEHWPLNHSDYLARQKFFGFPECRVIKSMKVIKTAQQCGATELLPTAFYELAISDIRDWSNVEICAAHHLASADLCRLLVGRERSAHRLRNLLTWSDNDLPMMWDPNNTLVPVNIFTARASMGGCTGIGTNRRWLGGTYHCLGLFNILKTKVAEHFFDGKSPFGLFRELQHASFYGSGPCRICTDWFMSVLKNKEQEMWENLAVDFDLPKIDPKRYSESMFKSF